MTCVCPANAKFYVDEFASASKSKVVSEIHFSSFQFLTLTFQSAFFPTINQKISISSSPVSSFDSTFKLPFEINVHDVKLQLSHTEDLKFLTFLNFSEIFSLELIIDVDCESDSVKDLILYLCKFNLKRLKIVLDRESLHAEWNLPAELLELVASNNGLTVFSFIQINSILHQSYFAVTHGRIQQFVTSLAVILFKMEHLIECYVEHDFYEEVDGLRQRANDYLNEHPNVTSFPNWYDNEQFVDVIPNGILSVEDKQLDGLSMICRNPLEIDLKCQALIVDCIEDVPEKVHEIIINSYSLKFVKVSYRGHPQLSKIARSILDSPRTIEKVSFQFNQVPNESMLPELCTETESDYWSIITGNKDHFI